jgi:hypothetical protein
LPILAERGYLIPAVNTDNTDYVSCARHLARSLHSHHPAAQVCLLTDNPCTDPEFNHVVLLPHGDQSSNSDWRLDNDWQVFAASPYRQTIKLEADMLIASGIDHWWTLLQHKDVVISQGCRDWYDQPANSRRYRRVFDENHLPDVYNAITYWRLSTTAKEFFSWVRRIFAEWDTYRRLLKFSDDQPTTDVVYAMAAVIMGPEQVTLPIGFGPTIVHMKQHVIPTKTADWTQELVWEFDPLRINTVAQWGAFHYHVKDWLNEQ